MTISFPLSLPTVSGIARITLRMRKVVGDSTSPFTAEQQVYEHQGEWWEADVSLPPMRRAKAALWQAFFASLRGKRGTFLMGDPDAVTPQGNVSGSTPLVDTSGSPTLNRARDRQLYTKGWAISTSGVMKAGDYIQLGTGSDAKLHLVLADASSNGSGLATLEIWPALQTDYSDGAAIVVTGAKGCFRMITNDLGWSADAASIYGLTFGARSV